MGQGRMMCRWFGHKVVVREAQTTSITSVVTHRCKRCGLRLRGPILVARFSTERSEG